MKSNIMLILKGFVIGLGKVIPGVSGAIIAIMLNVYEPALNAISRLKDNLYKNTKYLAMLGMGIVLAVILGSNIIIFLLDRYYIETIFLFLGMMASGVILIFKEVRKATVNDIVTMIIIIGIVIAFSCIELNDQFLNNSSILISICLYFFSGILDAFCSIVPGISGTAVLMMFGTYDTILRTLGSILDFSVLINNLVVIIPFFSGILFGGYFISKIISYVFGRYHCKSYCGILIFSLLSVWSILKNVFSTNHYSISQILVACIFFLLGYFITRKLNI